MAYASSFLPLCAARGGTDAVRLLEEALSLGVVGSVAAVAEEALAVLSRLLSLEANRSAWPILSAGRKRKPRDEKKPEKMLHCR